MDDNATTLTAEQKDTLIQAIAKIENLPEQQRWRETKNLLLTVNPRLKEVDQGFIHEIDKIRDRQNNEVGSSKSGGLRHLLEMPRYLYDVLLMMDPDLDEQITSKQPGESREAMRKLAKTFPEYRIAGQI